MYQDTKSFDGKVYLIDVNSPEFLENPYRFYRERRNVSPVIQIQEDVWSLTGYDIMNQVLSHPNGGRIPREILNEQMPERSEGNPIVRILDNWMLFQNPPKHTRLRKLVLKAFTPKIISQLEPFMRATMRDLIDEIKNNQNNEFDLVSMISYPLPVTVISEMMGIPLNDRYLFRKWSTDFAIALASEVSSLPDSVRQRLNQSAIDLTKYFEMLIERKKEDMRDDLVSTLINAGEGEDRLTTAEILSNCTLLLVAGHETTTSLISNGMNALMNHPDQFELLKSDLSLIPNAIEEFLRYDAPVQSIGRYVIDDIELDGYTFNKGHHISCILGAAGRDPKANPDPQKFDITREEINHVAFSKGIHYCLGANLAKMEAEIAFEEIVEEIPNLKLNGVPERNKNWLLRGLAKLPMKIT